MQVTIEVRVRFAAPFNVGTGALGDALTNKPTLKDDQQRPLIPGSAFKGRLRHTSERLLRALQDSDAAACHAPDPASTCPLDPHWLNDYCPICRIFGSPRRPSPLMFSDLRWMAGGQEAAPTRIRTGVSIRRNRRVAEPQRLYDLEAVDATADLTYTGAINGHVNDADAQALLALLVVSLRELQTLGGGRGSGLGRCEVEATLRINRRPVDEDWVRNGLQQGVQRWAH